MGTVTIAMVSIAFAVLVVVCCVIVVIKAKHDGRI